MKLEYVRRPFAFRFACLLPFLLWRLAAAPVQSEQVLFAFDDQALPFQHGLRLNLVNYHLSAGDPDNHVLRHGPPGSPDAIGCYYYGSVIEVNGELWMWYRGTGDHDPAPVQRHQRICFARSHDGRHWEKPALGLVEYAGSKANNLVELDGGTFFTRDCCVVVYEPSDPNPEHRFKTVFNGDKYELRLAVAYSPDGVHWKESPRNPRGPWLEPSGLIKWHGAYYLSGHSRGQWNAVSDWTRMLETYVSYDFENWSQSSAIGFRRDPVPPRPVTMTGNIDGEQVHLGAGLWNRDNVIIGFYGQWHGVPSNDRRLVSIDLGLVVSHDGLHYSEPIPDFRIIESRENIYAWPREAFVGAPALTQGEGFINRGDETLVWYGAWNSPPDGIRLAHWKRDRLGYLQPFVPSTGRPEVISSLLDTGGQPVTVSVNASGLNQWSKLEVSILDEQFGELAGFRAADCTGPSKAGLRERVSWRGRDTVAGSGPFRIKVNFAGIRPEDLRLYALYVTPAQTAPHSD